MTDLSQLSDSELDALADEQRNKLDSTAAFDPIVVLAIARLLLDLYREVRRRAQ
jgi:hypothetical protein